MQRRGIRVLLILAILLGAVALFAVLTALREPPAKKEAEILAPLVEVMELQPMQAAFRIDSQGSVRPRTQTTLSSEVSGTIVEISPKWIAGGVFSAGDVLMRIDPTNYNVAVDQAKALVRQRQIEFDGAEKLLSQGYRAEAEHASAAAALASARAELTRANRNLERTYIRLPYDGMVRSKEADLGQFVSPGTRLGVVFATDQAEVRLPLTDQDLRFLDLPGAADISKTGSSEGPTVSLTATRRGETRSWEARITRTEGVIDENSRVTYAVAAVTDPYRLSMEGEVLPMGTFVRAEIEGISLDGVFLIPRSAIRGADELLFASADDKVEIRRVTVLRSEGERAYVSDNVHAGERLILTAVESPVSGMSVRTTLVEGE
ncbi:MAG: efflux RND transporter periplasmic adaptor subunit [Woeseiaceae bacterium]|nr:efflux RND transporter periplasmic adaptor subunit [Woeseiaceae bacterium]